MEEDLKEIAESSTLSESIERLIAKIRYVPPLEPKDFIRDYGDARFGRLLLYFLIFDNSAIDWDQSGTRIGFDDAELLAGFQPQFHHVFPKKFLEGHVSDDLRRATSASLKLPPFRNGLGAPWLGAWRGRRRTFRDSALLDPRSARGLTQCFRSKISQHHSNAHKIAEAAAPAISAAEARPRSSSRPSPT
jgi:hypothetical protein